MGKKILLSILAFVATFITLFIAFFGMIIVVPKAADAGLDGEIVTMAFLGLMMMIALAGMALIYRILRRLPKG